jgi:hypothetical protein
MKTTKMNWIALGAMGLNLFVTAPGALAQNGSGVGGGRFKEEEIAIFFGRLKDYFSSDEWQENFPEAVEYNRTHRESIQSLMS